MTGRPCAVPGCQHAVSGGVFCTGHYFALPRKETAFLNRWRFKISRCEDEQELGYMREQLQGYIASAVRRIQNAGTLTSSPSVSASARREPPKPAGATLCGDLFG